MSRPRTPAGWAVAACGAALCLAPGLGVAPAGAAAPTGDGDPRVAFRIDDERVVESSGLALSRTRPGLAYTVNDSGDEARVLVLSTRSGAVVGETRLEGAEHDDFEALAPAPGGRLVVADIGDNGAERDSVEVYVIPEPAPGEATVRPRTVSLTYSGGPRDAESVVVAGTTLYVVSKEVPGAVYAAPVLASGRDAFRLHRVASAPSLVTDAALLPDGDVVLRDYQRGFLADLPGWRLSATFPLPRVEQGETVASAARGRTVYVGAEGEDTPVYAVRVPTAGDAASGSGGTVAPSPAAPAQPRRDGDEDLDVRPSGLLVAVSAAASAAAALWWRARRRARRGGPAAR